MQKAPLTRRQFFSRLRAAGFSKSNLQLSRISLTYERKDADGRRETLSVPKHHDNNFHVLGNVPYSGMWNRAGSGVRWGRIFDPAAAGLDSMLEVALGLVTGDLTVLPPE